MTKAVPAYVTDYLNAADSEDDNLVTDISRVANSRKQQQLDKWKQNLRIQLIREQYAAQEKEKAETKPILLRLLNLGRLC